MKGWQMYTEIQSQKNLGFGKYQVAEHLGLNYRTVSRYWDMSPEEFERTILSRKRKQCLDLYEGVILDWLKQQPGLSGAEVLDRLKEHYDVEVSDRSVRRLVEQLRDQHGIPKCISKLRQYSSVEDPPMGFQMQVDLGVSYVEDVHSRSYRKLYVVGCVLSHSRYKWGEWYTKALTSDLLTLALEECFEFFGGMPAELVFDQDRLLAVDENYGDIIYTKEFEQFRQRMGFSVYLCRSGDPESKGKVESTIKYFKRGFARHRKFFEIDIWNEDFLAWLARTANAKVHGTTKKVPAEVFCQEKLFLKPVPCTRRIYTPIVTRDVHKDNTIIYKGCRYSVPLGTYYPGREVALEEIDGMLRITDTIDPVVLAEHPLSEEKGRLIKKTNHGRDYSETLDAMEKKLLEKLMGWENAELFIRRIRQFKGRYVRDQFQLVERTVTEYGDQVWKKALTYCVTNSLFSATEFRDATQYFDKQFQEEQEALSQNPKVVLLKNVQIQKRPLSEYTALLKGGDKP
jgi:hypothetical protein